MSFSTAADGGDDDNAVPPVDGSSGVPRPRISVSFSGCGFLGMYHVGSLQCWRDHCADLEIVHASGASAGSIVAAACLIDIPVETLKDKFMMVVKEASSLPFGAFNPRFNVNRLFGAELDRVLPEDAHEIATGQLAVSLTTTSMQNEIIKEFESRKELIDALVCSCFLPAFSAYNIPTYQGRSYLDGGLSNNQPVLDEKTIKISPFCGASHICPRDGDENAALPPSNPSSDENTIAKTGISAKNPLSKDFLKFTKMVGGSDEMDITAVNIRRLLNTIVPASDLEDLYTQGYEHTKKFIQNKDLISKHYYDHNDGTVQGEEEEEA